MRRDILEETKFSSPTRSLITNDVNLDDFLKSGTRKIQGTRKLGEYSSDTGSSSSFSHHYSMLTYHLYLCADHCVMICSFSLHLHFVHPRVFVDIHSYSFAYNKSSPPLSFTILCPDQEALLQPQHYICCRVEVVEVIGRRRQIACSLFFPNKIFTQAPELSSTVSLVTTGEAGNITHTLRHALFPRHAQLQTPFYPACINSPLPSYRGEFLSP